MDPADANAGGSIGIIVDIASNDCVTAVSPGDGGAFEDPDTGETTSAGLPPSSQSCAESIDRRKTCNEWLVRNYRPLAIFAYGPIRVSQPITEDYIGEVEIDRDLAFALFPEYWIFSAHKGRFLEYDRQHRRWNEVTFVAIMAATPAA
jgi:hypothetical protein